MRTLKLAFFVLVFLSLALCSGIPAYAQSTTGIISGRVVDQKKAVIPGVGVTVRNMETNVARSTVSDDGGRFRFPALPVGTYEVTAEISGFARYVRSPITLTLNQEAVLDVVMQVAPMEQVVTVTSDVSLLNTTNAEVGVRFDTRRISELPLATDRNVFNIALSAAGVSQLASGQSEFAAGTNFSVNGMRVRSNNFMIDGVDSNDPSISGRQQPINNPDIIQEVRLITNQFLPEFGRSAGSVVNVITKRGTNDLHGSLFWFHNDNALNALNNLDKFVRNIDGSPRFLHAPFRVENQFGGTVGGPVRRDKTFFFGSLQRWTDRRLNSGATVRGVPTTEGQRLLQQLAGDRPQVQALLRFLPPAQLPIGQTACTTALDDQNRCPVPIPLGALGTSTSRAFNNWQWMANLDHHFSEKHILSGRYIFNDQETVGEGQATPPRMTSNNTQRQQLFGLSLTSTLSPRLLNEFRLGYQRLGNNTTATDPLSETIPSIEINQLGLRGFNAAGSRTAIGLAVNLPQFRFNNTFQLQETASYNVGEHALKFGIDFRRVDVKSFFFPTVRGLLRYPTLQAFVNDVPEDVNINKPLPGGEILQYYLWYDYFAFVQDEWKVRPNFTLTYGLRYETPGDATQSLVPPSQRIVQAAGGDTRFALSPVPKRHHNFQPRFGFNWNPRTDAGGIVRFLTGGDKLVLRGGYSRTNDYAFINIALNIASSFPFVAAINTPGLQNAFTILPTLQLSGLDPMMLTRTIVEENFRSPIADQFTLEIQRELTKNVIMRVGYVGTKGTRLFETVDGNPNTSTDPRVIRRVDPTRGVIRLRANSGSSIYHSLQVSVDHRLSHGFSLGAHYTWSAFIDTASDVFNPSVRGEIAVAQDSFNRRADRGRSTYDRPHRFTANFVYELPFFARQSGLLGHLLGGWQMNAFITRQTGAPFTVLLGSDPMRALAGISALVGNAIRPNQNTNLNLRGMSIEEILQAGGRRLFSGLRPGQRVGNVGRNTLRADGIGNIDLGIIKNTNLTETQRIQFRMEMYNATNTRNFGIPESVITSNDFLNQWGTDGGNRRIIFGLRYIF